MRSKLLIIGLILCSALQARELSWDWWPTGIQDSVSPREDTLRWTAGLGFAIASGDYMPFWLTSNTNGDVSTGLIGPISGSITGGVYKTAAHPERWWDYDFGVQLTARVPELNAFLLTAVYFNQLYAHARLYIFDITVGIKPMIYETQDTALTMGSLLFSGNSYPLPRITIGIDRYTPFPGCYGYFEFKGGITHAWFVDNVYMQNSYLHHKFAAIRLGGRLPVNISYEFHHAAQWGGSNEVFGDIGSDWTAFKHVFMAQGGGTMYNDQMNAQGNHVGSQQLMLTVKGKQWEVDMYWQNFFEDNFAFIGNGQNITDGLWGVSMKQNRWPFIQGVTYEFLNTTDQSGPWHDRDGLCYAGDDKYYQNFIFQNGWSHFYRTIGTPFITSPYYNKDKKILHTLNSRVRVHHIGVRGDIYGFQYRIKASYARNYGNDPTTREVLSTNTALLIEVNKHVEKAWGLDFGVRLAADIGNQFGNTFGGQIIVRKNGIAAKW